MLIPFVCIACLLLIMPSNAEEFDWDNLEKYKVKDLRKFLHDRGVDDGVMKGGEKRDLIRLVRESKDLPIKEQSKPEEPSPSTKSQKSSASSGSKQKSKGYTDLTQLLTQQAEKICNRLLQDSPKWRTNPEGGQERCDLFVKRVEHMATTTGKNFIGSLNKPMKQVLAVATSFPYSADMKRYLRAAAQFTLEKPTATTEEIDSTLNKDFSQWFLNVAVQDRPRNPMGGMGGMGGLSREALESLRAQGVNIGDFGVDDNDEL